MWRIAPSSKGALHGTARRIALFAVVLALGACIGAEQVNPEAPVGAGGLAPTMEDKDAGLVGLRDGFRLSAYRVVAIERFAVAESEIEDEGDRRFAQVMTTFFQAELTRRLRDTNLFDRVVTVSDPALRPDDETTIVLRGVITRLGRGSEALRYLLGRYGVGRSRAQVEMFFVDAQSGQVVMVTADRRVNRRGGDEGSLRESFHDIAKDVGKFLLRLSNGQAPGKS